MELIFEGNCTLSSLGTSVRIRRVRRLQTWH